MSWLVAGATSREEVLALHPELAAEHQRVLEEIWSSSIDPIALELCRLRMATIVGNTVAWSEPRSAAAVAAGLDENMVASLPQWVTDERFDAPTKACLRLAEQYVIDIHGVTDDQVNELSELIWPDGVVTLTTAFATWEISHRFDNALLGQTTTSDNSTEEC